MAVFVYLVLIILGSEIALGGPAAPSTLFHDRAKRDVQLKSVTNLITGEACSKDNDHCNGISECHFDTEEGKGGGHCRVIWWFWLIVAVVAAFVASSLISCVCCPCCFLYGCAKKACGCIFCCCK